MSNTVTQEAIIHNSNYKEEELQQAIIDKMQHLGIPKEDVKITEEGIELTPKYDGLKLHTLMLQMENMGLNMKMTKKTIIEVY